MSETFENTSDAELVREVQTGRTDVFDEIDRRYRPVLLRFLSRHVDCVHQTEELVQRTLVRAFEMIGQLESGDKLVGWLHRIAFRFAAAEGRKRTIASLDHPESAEPIVELPNETDIRDEKKSIWKIAKEQLTSEEFEILVLKYRDELGFKEIAARIGKSEGAVRVQLHRARQKLLPVFEQRRD